MNNVNITEIIEKKIRELKITALDISFNELADMYDKNELIINPDYQRTFRWDIEKQSRFIESLLMEMPIPAIYVIELEQGIYELIDGLQRISSYLNYRGMLKKLDEVETNLVQNVESEEIEIDDEDAIITVDFAPFALQGCDIIKELNGCVFEDLQAALKIKLKRSYIRMEILRKGINPELKYHMFKRLNTGGEKLEPQEIRNCTIRLVNSKFINFINELSRNKDFIQTIAYISSSKKQKKLPEELVLRFLALKNDENGFKHDVASYLTNYMEIVSLADSSEKPIFDYDKEKDIFENTFSTLNAALGKQSFSAYKGNSENLSGFNVYQYEAITTGMQIVLEQLVDKTISVENFREKIMEIKKNKDFKSATVGGGKNSIGVFRQRVSIVRKGMEELIHELQ
ncbi:protein of unknown function DUF262 [Desulfofarcimen acetoxidans DSM 771]|uniref:GmrSD restriction endonucleases N-terminal domain-containing protein n=1 Tax=Desulfofarcimen acetoxidans (strain ATCC 49208 / DSM 771 / KCTC 5769 / VKM B-1644 / 5575) TaxID=485916 RepID=C8VVI5_DESAS|nr:DUF262 domain-containing protein [Desulfofarcimen acetoxidans]ACV62300.1 protein of unknown function DUF262 [Desulfofarcimen acetoxidans DSM 771]